MIVINNGEIFVNLRSLLQAPEYFYISPNVEHQLYGKPINVHVDSPKKGFYTFYVNSEPYSGCVKTTNGICNITENNGNYTVSAIFENSTQYAVSYPIVINFYSPPYVILSGTYIDNGNNVTLYADVKNGYGNSTYTFYYSNGTAINSCKYIKSSTCVVNASIPPRAIKITIYNPSSSVFDGINGAQVELHPNLKYFGFKDLGYDRFFYGSTELYSWCESNCSSGIPNVWINIPSGIAGGQKITITLNESIDINEAYSVSIINNGGPAKNSITLAVLNVSYPYFSGHMGSDSQNDNIGEIMNPGLLYQYYYNGGSAETPSSFALYNASVIKGTVVNTSDLIYTALTAPFYTNIYGSTQNINANASGHEYVIINYQYGYSDGSPFNSTAVPSPADTFLGKAVGFVVIPQSGTLFHTEDDDGDIINISNYGINDSYKNWLFNPTNILSYWRPQTAAIETSSSLNAGTYRFDYLYINWKPDQSYFSLWR